MFRYFVADAEPEAQSVPQRRGGAQFPLLWLLVPQIAACAFCANAPWASAFSWGRSLVAGTLFLVVAAVAILAENLARRGNEFSAGARHVWQVFFPVAAFFIFCAWWSVSVPPLHDLSKKSAREVAAELRIERAYSSLEKKSFSGIARVENVSGGGLASLVGSRVWFSVSKKEVPTVVPAAARARFNDVDFRTYAAELFAIPEELSERAPDELSERAESGEFSAEPEESEPTETTEKTARSAGTLAEDAFVEGARFRALGIVRGISEENFEEESFRNFLRRERVSAAFSAQDAVEIAPLSANIFPEIFASAGDTLREKLFTITSADDGKTVRSRAGKILGAMLLGDRSLLTETQKENFLLTGTVHIFAVSGLHVGVLAAGAFGLFRLVFRGRGSPKIASAVSLALLFFYVCVVGAPPSAVRAWLMLLFVFVGTLFGRGRGAFHGLLFSAFVALLVDPMLVGNTGFRLSHLVVAAILLYGAPASARLKAFFSRFGFARFVPATGFWAARGQWREALRAKRRELVRKVFNGAIDGACISFAAFIAGLPLVVAMFGYCAFLSMPANILLVPLVIAGAWLGAAALCVAFIPFVGELFGAAVFSVAALPLAVIDLGTEALAKLPGTATLTFPRDEFGAIGIVLVFLLFFFGETLPALRERPALRFSLPPVAVIVYLLVFSY